MLGLVDGDNWLTKDGLYPKAIKAMIDRLTTSQEGNYSICETFSGAVALSQIGLAALLTYISFSF